MAIPKENHLIYLHGLVILTACFQLNYLHIELNRKGRWW